MKLIITESQMDKLYGYINGPKKKLMVTENQYKRLLMEYEVREDINKIFNDIKVGDGIMFTNNVLPVTKKHHIGFQRTDPNAIKDKINKFEVLNIHIGKSLKESGLFLKKVDDGRYPKNIFFLPKDAFITNANIIKAFMSYKDKLNVDKFNDDVADNIMNTYEVDGNLDPSIWKKFDIKDIGYIQISNNAEDFDDKDNAKYVYSMDKNVEKGQKETVIDVFKENLREYVNGQQTYKLNFYDDSWLLLNIKKKIGNKIYVEFLNDPVGDIKDVDGKSYDNNGEAKNIIDDITPIRQNYNVKEIYIDISNITHKFLKYDYSKITKDEKLKLLDVSNNNYIVQNSSKENVVSVNMTLVVVYEDVSGTISEVTSGGITANINLNGVVNITQAAYEINVQSSIADFKKAGWNNKTIIDAMNKNPNKFLQLIGGETASIMHGKSGGTILAKQILNKWGIYSNSDEGDNNKYNKNDGRKISFKIIDKLDITDSVNYGLFENLLSNGVGEGAFKQYVQNGKTYKTVKVLDSNDMIQFKMFIINELGQNMYEVNLQKINSRKKIAKLKIELT